jgi:mycofactocin precursor
LFDRRTIGEIGEVRMDQVVIDERGVEEPVEAPVATDEQEPLLVEGELLIEDVSIDGMCGVY